MAYIATDLDGVSKKIHCLADADPRTTIFIDSPGHMKAATTSCGATFWFIPRVPDGRR
jgi:hypothetical protein